METMELLLTIILCVLVTAADGSGPVVISVKEDDDVVLPCSLSSKENLESGLFDWKKDWTEGEKRVFMYDGGRYSGRDFKDQDQQFEGRVSHFPHELKNGNASIKITGTRVSDSGTYSCIFPRLQPRQTFSIQLLVVACRKPSARPIKITNDQAVLQCEVHGASPKPVLEWRDSSGNILPAKEAQVTERGGSYDIILQTTVTKSDNYSCVVTQKEICHQVHYDLLVYLPGPPAESSGAASEPSVTILDQSKDWSLLQCAVRGASPKPVLEWRDSSGNILPSKEAQVTERGGSYDIILQTIVTKSDHYSCVVTQEEFCHQVKGTVSVVMCGPPVGWMVFSGILSALLLLVLVGWGYSLYREKTKCSEERISSMI